MVIRVYQNIAPEVAALVRVYVLRVAQVCSTLHKIDARVEDGRKHGVLDHAASIGQHVCRIKYSSWSWRDDDPHWNHEDGNRGGGVCCRGIGANHGETASSRGKAACPVGNGGSGRGRQI